VRGLRGTAKAAPYVRRAAKGGALRTSRRIIGTFAGEKSMDRRTLLQLVGGIAVSGVRPFALQAPRADRIVIAGAGILGANIAYQLARRGARVTLLDRAAPAQGATANSFAWIN